MKINCVFDTYVDVGVEIAGEQLAALQSAPQHLETEDGNLTITHDGLCILRQYNDRIPTDYHGEWEVVVANVDPNRPSDKKLYLGTIFIHEATLDETTARKELTDIGMEVGPFDGTTRSFRNCYAVGKMITQMRFGGKRYRFIAYTGKR